MGWFNTTKEKNKEELDKRAYSQETIIGAYFTQNQDAELTPFEVHALLRMNCPITSVRRAMTNLTTEGILVKTDTKIKEQYGVNNYRWKLKK